MRGMIFLPPMGVNEKGGSALETLRPPSRDLSETLDPVAAKLCAAARKLLARGGFRAVTINSVTREAGEYRTSIAYHFGGKEGLLAAVADSIFPRDKCAAAVAECERHPAGPERVAAQMKALREMAEDREAFLAFIELWPHILRDKELRNNLASLYEWYRELDLIMFGAGSQDSEELKYAAALVLAAVDGFSFQYCLDPENFDMTKAFGVLERLISDLVANTLQTGSCDVAVSASS
jgi:AcrR family transcriptional regulator